METAEAAPNTATRRFPCPGCGATLVFSAGAGKLKCEYCETEIDIPPEDKPATPDARPFAGPVERRLEELLAGGGERGWGVTTYSVGCKTCGATTTFPEKVTSGSCAFCGSNVVVEKPADASLIKPETLIPFKVTKEQAAQHFSKWVASLWFRPTKLKKMARVHEIRGVYTPFWTFDAHAETRWKAESGYYYHEEESYTDKDGKRQTRRVTKTRWQPSSGHHSANYDDVLICASKGLPSNLIQAIEPYSTTKDLVPYKPDYLSGWAAEEYAVGPQEGWQKGQERFEKLEYAACSKEVPGDTHRNLQISMRLDNVTWKHCLLPVYIAAYRYNGKSYRFLVNGETGKVSGDAPYSWIKITLFVLALLLLFWLIFGSGKDGGGGSYVPSPNPTVYAHASHDHPVPLLFDGRARAGLDQAV